jgi:rod shape-determining protein MreC
MVVIGIVIGVWQNRASARGREGVVLTPVRATLFPLQVGTARLQATIQDTWNGLFSGRRIAAENATLTAEITRLRAENETLRVKAVEADRLRAALKFVEAEKKPSLVAPVISWLPSQNADTITVGKGTRDGVAAKTIVRTATGLVGLVYESGPLTSQVMLLTDAQSAIGAVVRRAGKAKGTGIVQGGGRGEALTVVYLKRESDVLPGDLVYSSGYGGVVPPDIPIGKVVAVTEDKPRFLKTAVIEPAADAAGDLREVLLLQ